MARRSRQGLGNGPTFQAAPLSLVAMPAVEAHKPGVTHYLVRHKTVRAALEHGHQFSTARTDRLHQTAADLELAHQRLGDLGEGRRYENGVVRRFRRNAFGTVADDDKHIRDVLRSEVSASQFSEVGPSLDACDE